MAAATTPRRTDRLVARVTPADKVLLEQAAGLEGCSVAVFAVAHLRAAAEKVIHEHEAIRLNASESRRFVEALLAAPKPPTRRMKSALALHRQTVTEH